MSDLRKLMAGYVDDGKRKEITAYLEERGIKDLHDVRLLRDLAKLLDIDNGINPLRKELYRLGFLHEVPVHKIIGTVSVTGRRSPYLDEVIVGKEGVERTREVLFASDEFREGIQRRYSSLFGIKSYPPLNRLVGIDGKRSNTLKKWLFEHGFFRELPLDFIFSNLALVRNYNPYADPEVVGDNIERFNEEVRDSGELRRYVCEKYDSLMGMKPDFALAGLLGISKGHNGFRRDIFELGFFTELPVKEVLANLRVHNDPNPYLNPKIVGEEMVENYRRILIDSDEFAEWICSKFDSLDDINEIDYEVMFALGMRTLAYHELRKRLFDEGLLTEIPVEKAVEYIRSSRVLAYFDPNIVGEEMVELYKNVVMRSREFKVELYQRYPTLDHVGQDRALSVFFDVDFRQGDLRRKLYDEGYYPFFSVEEVVAKLDIGVSYALGAHFDLEVVGDDVEKHKQTVLDSEEFGTYLTTKYGSLIGVKKGGRLGNFLGLDSRVGATVWRRELYNLGFLTEIPLDSMKEIVENDHLCPYIDQAVVGDDVEKNRQVILGSDEFRNYIHGFYSSPDELKGTHRTLARILGVEDRILVLRQALVDGGYYE